MQLDYDIIQAVECPEAGAQAKNIEHGKSARALYHPADPADSSLAFSILRMAAIYCLISCACYDLLSC